MTEISNKSTFLSNRRGLLIVGSGAALAGVGMGWWRLREHQLPVAIEKALWEAEFEQLDGQSLALSSLKGRPLVINFWATWCPPCVEEMPLLDRFYQENKLKGWQILGIAIDQPSSVRRFQAQFPVSYPLVLGGVKGNEFGSLLGNAQGSLPYTMVLDREGRVLQRKLGRLDPSDLVAWK